jgi:S-adenosylmethionine:tRNA ribosyltransferase-isomerase
MDISQYDYALPEELIAQQPCRVRSASRLLVVKQSIDYYHDTTFNSIENILGSDDMLVVNDTRVLPARILAKKPTGGKIEIMLERILNDGLVLVLLRSSKPIKDGQVLIVGEFSLVVTGRQGQFFKLQFPNNSSAEQIFELWGSTPLPPYISRKPTEIDSERYQTVYAKNPGAVAAPTAGLHFDDHLIEKLKQRGVMWGSVTLHVGAGTFQPVRCQDIRSHQMHKERYFIDEKVCEKIAETRRRGGKVVAVGTTVVRALESAAQSGDLVAGHGETDLFILPGYEFKVIDGLITNFHLPKSTLLMMVSAFSGYEKIMAAYQYAVSRKYRFFSYGDAMYMEKN